MILEESPLLLDQQPRKAPLLSSRKPAAGRFGTKGEAAPGGREVQHQGGRRRQGEEEAWAQGRGVEEVAATRGGRCEGSGGVLGFVPPPLAGHTNGPMGPWLPPLGASSCWVPPHLLPLRC